MVRKCFETLCKFWFLWPVLFFAGCSGATTSVLTDNQFWLNVGVGAILIAFIMMVVTALIALQQRRVLVFVLCFFSFVVCAVGGFFAGIAVGAGQHHPPHFEDKEVCIPEWSDVLRDDSMHVTQLQPTLEKGSWWTDGQWFYQVKGRQGQTYQLEGYGLHEGGAVCCLEIVGDHLLNVLPSEGYTTFAQKDWTVCHYNIIVEDTLTTELLVAFPPGEATPRRVLQRVKGNDADEAWMLDYVRQCLYDVLADDYIEASDRTRQWLFREDGTVQMPGMDAPERYQIELGYHMPTGVLRLPGGRRVGVVRSPYDLQLYQACYDKTEEFWVGTDSLLMTLHVQDGNGTMLWAFRRPAMTAMMDVTDSTYQSRLRHDRLEGINDPMTVLNYYLLPLDQDEEDGGEVDEEQ